MHARRTTHVLHVHLVAAIIGGTLNMSAAAAVQVLPSGIPTIFLPRGPGAGTSPGSIAYHPVHQQYYGSNLGGPDNGAWVFDSAGNRIQTLKGVGFNSYGWNFNSNSGAIEVNSFNHGPLAQPVLTAAGLLTGNWNQLLPSMPGSNGEQTLLAYDSNHNLFYSRNENQVVNRVSRVDGSLLSSFSLDLAAAGTNSSHIAGYAIGYDPTFDVLIVPDAVGERALVFQTNGAYIGASQLGIDVQAPYRMGYANGQIFVFNDSSNGWQGYTILVPAPSGFALLALVACRKRRSRT